MLSLVATAAVAFAGLEADVSPDGVAGWSRGRRADPSAPISLVVALAQPAAGVAKLERVLSKVSDPAHPEYGQHYPHERIHQLVAPPASAIAAVRAHFASHGVSDLSAATPNGDMLVAETTVGAVEAALGAEYYEYAYGNETTALRVPSYGGALPPHVREAIAFVSPTVRLPSLASPRPTAAPARPDGFLNTPKSLRKLYKVGDTVGKADANKQAVTGFLGQKYSEKDLADFNVLFDRPNLSSKSRKLAPVGDAAKGLISGVEAMLDAEYVTALGPNIASEFWGFKGRAPDNPQNEPFLKWLLLVANTTDDAVPKLFSTSYGEDESSVSLAYATRINVEFVKAGARGISLLFASGDSGANCVDTGGPQRFEPNWPAASPYVTAVGGTTGTRPEEAVGLSSGGFSNRYPTPAWQQAAVAACTSPRPASPTARSSTPAAAGSRTLRRRRRRSWSSRTFCRSLSTAPRAPAQRPRASSGCSTT